MYINRKNSFQISITFGLAKVYVLGMGMMSLSPQETG